MSGTHCSTEGHPLAAAFYADGAVQRHVVVVENAMMARETFRLRLSCPEIARRITPGQFLMLRLVGGDDPLLGRPLALFDTWLGADGRPAGVDVGYLVVGRMTRRLSALRAGESLDAWGPLGNGFLPEVAAPVDRLLMVAGGIGQTPFLALGRAARGGRSYGADPSSRATAVVPQVTLCYGVRSKEYLAGVDDFSAAGIEVRLASDDGSVGRKGFVTAVLQEALDESAAQSQRVRIVCCGPEKMMEAVAGIAAERGLPCEVSLETPMACGIGVCFSCVVRVKQADGGWDYKRTCVEGPVFDAERIAW